MHLVGVHSVGPRHLGDTRTRFHRHLHNLSLLGYRSPAPNATYFFGLNHAPMFCAIQTVRQRGRANAYAKNALPVLSTQILGGIPSMFGNLKVVHNGAIMRRWRESEKATDTRTDTSTKTTRKRVVLKWM
jgi:hypothetical protein